MEKITKHYSKAPIREAILDLKVILPEDFSVEDFLEIHKRIQDRFPFSSPIHIGSVFVNAGLDVQDNPNIQVNTNQKHDGFLFKNQDNLEIFQATLQGFTFNKLAPYDTWESFISTAKELWEVYRSVCRPAFVTRVAVRYVNQLDIPSNGPTDLQRYLKTLPDISTSMPQSALNSFFMQLQIPQEDLNCMLILNENLVSSTSSELLTVVLDIDLFRQSVWASDDEGIWQFLEQLRDRKNQIFRASITPEAEELIN